MDEFGCLASVSCCECYRHVVGEDALKIAFVSRDNTARSANIHTVDRSDLQRSPCMLNAAYRFGRCAASVWRNTIYLRAVNRLFRSITLARDADGMSLRRPLPFHCSTSPPDFCMDCGGASAPQWKVAPAHFFVRVILVPFIRLNYVSIHAQVSDVSSSRNNMSDELFMSQPLGLLKASL